MNSCSPEEVDDTEDLEHEDKVDGPGIVDLLRHLHRRRVGFESLRVERLLVHEIAKHKS